MAFSTSRLDLAEISAYRFDARSPLPAKHQCVWNIQSGIVQTMTWIANEEYPIVLGIWGAGDVIGEIFSSTRPYQIECLTRVEALPIAFGELENAADVLQAHLHSAEQLMIIRSCKRVDSMLLRLLDWLAQRFGQSVEEGRLIDLRLTHQDLADILGTTRVTITRILNQLEQQGAIQKLPLQRILLREEEVWHYEI